MESSLQWREDQHVEKTRISLYKKNFLFKDLKNRELKRDFEMAKISKLLLNSLFIASTSAENWLVNSCNDETLDVSKRSRTHVSSLEQFPPLD